MQLQDVSKMQAAVSVNVKATKEIGKRILRLFQAQECCRMAYIKTLLYQRHSGVLGYPNLYLGRAEVVHAPGNKQLMRPNMYL